MKSFLLSTFVLLAIPSSGFSFGLDSIYVQANGHIENRNSTSKNNFGGQVGVDFEILGPIYAGPRLGYYRLDVVNLPSNGTKAKIGGGLHIYGLLPLGLFSVKGGIASDLLAGDDHDPVYLYTGLETGVRMGLPLVYFEVPIEAGMFPAFDSKIYLFTAGLQVGVKF